MLAPNSTQKRVRMSQRAHDLQGDGCQRRLRKWKHNDVFQTEHAMSFYPAIGGEVWISYPESGLCV